MRGIKFFLASMAGRIFMVLVSGLVLFSAFALVLGEIRRRADTHRFDLDMAIERVADFIAASNGVPVAELRTRRDSWFTPGTKLAATTDRAFELDGEMTRLLERRLKDARPIRAQVADISTCMPLQAQQDALMLPKCWVVTAQLRDGTTIRMAVNTPLHIAALSRMQLTDPLYIAILACGFAVVAFFVARMAAAPLGGLSRAAKNLSDDIDSAPLAEHGPVEVREAARAFNAMQDRLRQIMIERTHMLAAITHDLQTPLTRLRLRLEKVGHGELRDRLIADLAETQRLVTEGLDLARFSGVSSEAAVQLDLHSLLVSMIEDEADAGRNVTLLSACRCDVFAQPQSLRRCLANLIDNALKYAGSAALIAECKDGEVDIHVLDNGPGVPPEQLEQLFQPFVRLETSRSRETGGAGLGLTIARSLAQQNGGRLTIRNRPIGGLDVLLSLPCSVVLSS